MNDQDLVQHYFLRNIYSGLNETYNHITAYITSDNTNLDNINHYENYKLLQEIINFANVINNDLIKLKTNEISIDNIKRKRDE